MTSKTPLPTEIPRSETGQHIDMAFEEMAGPERLIHDFRVQARSEWDVLAALGQHLRDDAVRLRKLKVLRPGAGQVSVMFQCMGLGGSAARILTDHLKADPQVREVRLEYVLMTGAGPGSRTGT